MTLLLTILITPWIGSICAALMPANARNAEAWLAGLVALLTTVLLASLYPHLANDAVLRLEMPWSATLGLAFQLRLDGFSWLFAMLVAGMGLLVVVYARYYMSPADPVPRFFSFFLAFMGAMLGVVLSGNLLQMAMFWELTSLVSFMLIAYWHHRSEARSGARMALIVTGAGGLALLGGVLLIGRIVGSYDLDAVLAAADVVKNHAWYPAIVTLVALGALTKSAQFPFHFWLPHAMAAPTPVSAYLHSATMVKAGVFLLARLWPLLAGSDQWFWMVGGAGLCSLVIAGYLAMFQNDLKGVLAYSTISHLGLITLLLGMNSSLALVAAVFHMINHATFKASLFMAAGVIDHETGTRDIRRLSGLARVMPITATLAMVSAAAMAGVPLLNGFLSKEMFFAETVYLDQVGWVRIVLPFFATLAGVFSVAYSLRFIHDVFFGPQATDLPHTPHDPTRWMLLPSALLVVMCVLVGVFPGQTVEGFLKMATTALLGADAPHYDLALWHGLNLPVYMSLIALCGGVALYFSWLTRQRDAVPLLESIDGKRAFENCLRAMTSMASRILPVLSSDRLQTQLRFMMLVIVGGGILSLWNGGLTWGRRWTIAPDVSFILLWIVGATCAVMAAWKAKYHRFTALIFLGGTGLATSLSFVWLSAPDLALTQLAVEVVTAVLILLGLRWLPQRDRRFMEETRPSIRPHLRRLHDLLLAVLGGSGLAALSYAIMSRPSVDGISPFFVERSLPEGGGRNVVNVILVDFRGFDTFGEITVLVIVALTVFALLRRFRPAPESIRNAEAAEPAPTGGNERMAEALDAEAAAQTVLLPEGDAMIPAVLARLILPLALMVSMYFLMRGHNAPGGGFVGGLVFATAIILQYIVSGVVWVELRLRILPLSWMALGLLCAGAAGIAGALAGEPFLSSQTWHGEVPGIGQIHLSSVLVFDMGVYLVVVGATVLMLIAIAHQSLRRHSREHQASEVVRWK